ncbi:MAG: sigma-70 family RNA polymerase sigma factor [Clostridia bacterium]|nr:sigma-70 family RNA polymerase sigma factor [Clostridia bacterium]MBR4972992.1 sigma-70 family RNA polymerase sigma factor [Clostridia bacterium]
MSENFVENYEKLTDDEIVVSIKNGNYEMLQIIIDRYYPTIYSYIKKYCSSDYAEDAFQEATLALYSAVKDYDSKKARFSTFATLCIKRALISVLKNRQRKKDIPQELLLSIEDINLIDSNSPEKIFFDREDYKNLTDTIRLELSSLEYDVLQLYLSGERYSDIALKLGISEKSVDNSLARIRKKLKTV